MFFFVVGLLSRFDGEFVYLAGRFNFLSQLPSGPGREEGCHATRTIDRFTQKAEGLIRRARMISL
jgi:hypothetical protein